MRKAQKQLILEIMDSLHEAHRQIKKRLSTGQPGEAQALMAECQDIAVQIGTSIDDSEGDGTNAVHYLEKYCEALYQVHENVITDMTADNAFHILEENLNTTEKSVKNEIKIKLEIVFMPYKTSMWDSLESIWRAADADPDCEAYVVPIPYYERNPDHSLGDFHYEGKDFPEDVPVTHYENYDLEERKPDIIYIHNPYDDANYVTSVDPRFYSAELKKHTEMLVYVPYFFWKEVDPSDTAEVKRTSLFCIPAAVSNIDRFFAPSENLRQLHIRAYLSKFGNNKAMQLKAEKKYVTAASPKTDKLLAMTSENTHIPPEWAEKCAGKKVVFYNTAIFGLLNFPSEYIDKLRRVLKFFRGREDCVLLWRPHPLIESTINSMTPALRNGYLKLKNQFISENKGIYDETPDTFKAMYLSDMFYGDYSSISTQFELLGLPVLFQNPSDDEMTALEDMLNNCQKKVMKPLSADYIPNGTKIHKLIKDQVI
ncbi:MAG: hypothetical protein J6A19_05770 [Oscillospiraceae bacterium]|nr:hypothetical protein [Oscillospiraceae bacterium]